MALMMVRKSQAGMPPAIWAVSKMTRAETTRTLMRARSLISDCLRAVTESSRATPVMAMAREPHRSQGYLKGSLRGSCSTTFFKATPVAVRPSCTGMWAKSQMGASRRPFLRWEPATSSK